MRLVNRLLVIIMLTVFFFAAGCGNNIPQDENIKTKNEEVASSQRDEIKEQEKIESEAGAKEKEISNPEVGRTIKNETGEFTLIKKAELNEEYSTGSMTVTVTGATVQHVQVAEGYIDFFDSREFATVVIHVTVRNNSEDDICFYPDQAVLVTNTGEQVDGPHMFISDHIGGTFFGKIVKDGAVAYILPKSEAQEIEWVKLIMSAPHLDNTFDDVGKELRIKIDF